MPTGPAAPTAEEALTEFALFIWQWNSQASPAARRSFLHKVTVRANFVGVNGKIFQVGDLVVYRLSLAAWAAVYLRTTARR